MPTKGLLQNDRGYENKWVYEKPKTLAQGKWEIGPKGPKPSHIKEVGKLRGIQEPSLDTSMRR